MAYRLRATGEKAKATAVASTYCIRLPGIQQHLCKPFEHLHRHWTFSQGSIIAKPTNSQNRQSTLEPMSLER